MNLCKFLLLEKSKEFAAGPKNKEIWVQILKKKTNLKEKQTIAKKCKNAFTESFALW